jgi:hypothetical protein
MRQKKLKLNQISTDQGLLSLRTVNPVFVSRYRQAYRNGADMPLITVDDKNVVTSGNHRYQAMLEEFGKDHEITVYCEKFKSERARLEYFTKENATHGNPLDGISKKRIAMALIKTGAQAEEVARLFNVAVQKVEAWGNNCVMVTIGGGKAEPQPLKRGPEVEPGTTIKNTQYREHVKSDMGISPAGLAYQLIRWLQNGWIKNTAGNVKILNELGIALQKWAEEAQKVA